MTGRWVRPNRDKPHRCPECHVVAERAWSRRGYGPRTVFRCMAGCGVRWRSGERVPAYTQGFKALLQALGFHVLIRDETRRQRDAGEA